MIYLIRHGKTQANLLHLYCGSTDLPLSEQGLQELRDLHYAISPARWYTSGMKRTDETLACLFGSVPYEPVPELREVDFGAFEMKSYEQLREDPAYQAWISGDNERNVPPGGESGQQMTRRVLNAFHRLRQAGEDFAVITHGGVIAAIMQSLFPEEGRNRYQWQPLPGHGYRICEDSWEALF